MATPHIIPGSENQNVVKWYKEGKSPRQISALLKERGVEAHHTTVWRLIQRIAVGGGDMDVAYSLKNMRGKMRDRVVELDSIEQTILKAARINSDILMVNVVVQRLKLLETAHRMICRSLRLTGLAGKSAEKIHQEYSHAWDDDEFDESVFEPDEDEAVALEAIADEEKSLHLNREKPEVSSETRCNTPPAVADPATQSAALPSRNGPCPCGSGVKYKRCCAKDALHPERAQRAA